MSKIARTFALALLLAAGVTTATCATAGTGHHMRVTASAQAKTIDMQATALSVPCMAC